MNNQLTDREFWTSYWESKPDLAISVSADYLFHEQLEQIIRRDGVKTAIELGGFPGYYAIFLKKHFNLEATLLDYFVHQDIFSKVLGKNGLTEKDIHVIEADLFAYRPQEQYDLVLSCGLIEHFRDTTDIIRRHIGFLNPGGTLFITLPNFRGINGWVQKTFDHENYLKHNIHCMDISYLAGVVTELGLKVVKARYWGRFSVWLENKHQKPILTKGFIKLMWFIGKVITKVLPFESKIFSPYIILEAKR